jgi:hypothetical protein
LLPASHGDKIVWGDQRTEGVLVIRATPGRRFATGSTATFETAVRGYVPAAVEIRVAALTLALEAAGHRAAALEAEFARLQGAVPRPQPRSRVVAGKMEAIMLPAHEDAHRWIAQARSIALRERDHAEGHVAALLADAEAEATAAETRALQAARQLVAQAAELAEQIRTDSAAAAARIAACAPEILIGARRDAVRVVARSLAASSAPRRLRPSRTAAAANRSAAGVRAGAADTVRTITSNT